MSSDLAEALDAHRIGRELTSRPNRRAGDPALVTTLAFVLGLAPTEARVLARLVKFEHASKTELHRALYPGGEPVTGPHIVRVVVHTLRTKLAPRGIEIRTACGSYGLTASSRDVLRALFADFGADLISATTPPAAARAATT